jgi:superfamily I DNA/RNA helicase
MADRLLPVELTDVDGNAEGRKGTVSVFNGPEPEIQIATDTDAEINAVTQWLKQCQEDGIRPDEIGVFVRSDNEIERAKEAVSLSGMKAHLLSEKMQGASNAVFLSPMHLAKGLEFRAVVVMACDDEVIPSQARIETVTDDSDLEDVYNTERQLLYVALTRARDRLLVTALDPATEFLDDLNNL